MKTKIKLKTCPFCGGSAVMSDTNTSTKHYFVTCITPGCVMFHNTNFDYKTPEDAAKFWNRRVRCSD